LDVIRQSWAATDGPPHLRPIDPHASVANSVAVRIQYALSYAPGNLTINGSDLAGSYPQVKLVDPAAV
jgi:hypothetical protein